MFLPWPANLAGERTREVVHLEVQPAPFTREAALAQFGDSFIELGYEGLGEHPEIREAVLGLMDRSGSRCVSSAEWRAFLAERSIGNPQGIVYAFRDGLYRIAEAEATGIGSQDELECIDVTFLGAYDNHDWSPMARFDAGDLDRYPDVKAELERLAAGPTPAASSPAIPLRQWRSFQSREVDARGYRPYFVVFERLYSGWLTDDLVRWSIQTPWLRQIAGGIGAVAVLLGMILAIASYRGAAARPGIPVAAPWFTVFCDVISFVGGAIFTVLAIDTLWVGPLGQSSLIGLNAEWPSTQPITGLHFVSLPVVFIALPLFTLWLTSLSSQRVEVDGEGVTSHGALGSVSIAWQDLEHVRLREQRNPFSFTVVDFRSLQKVLDLKGRDFTMTINEPGSRSRKRKILEALILHVPEDKKNLIKEIEVKW